MANPTQADVQRIVAEANKLKAEGYFGRVAQGDQRAAAYFTQFAAYRTNPLGNVFDFGRLTKSPGETQVDGFAEDAVCFGSNPSDLGNVVDLINGTGAPGASIGGSIKERRPTNLWSPPLPLTPDQLSYLLSGGSPIPPQPPTVVFPPRNETMAAFNAINEKYHQKGRANRVVLSDADPYPLYIDNEGIAVWLQQYLLYRVNGKSHQAAVDQVLADIEAAWQ